MNIYAVNLQIFYEYKALYAKKIVFYLISILFKLLISTLCLLISTSWTHNKGVFLVILASSLNTNMCSF